MGRLGERLRTDVPGPLDLNETSGAAAVVAAGPMEEVA